MYITWDMDVDLEVIVDFNLHNCAIILCQDCFCCNSFKADYFLGQ